MWYSDPTGPQAKHDLHRNTFYFINFIVQTIGYWFWLNGGARTALLSIVWILNLLYFVFLQLRKNDIQEESAFESHHPRRFWVSHRHTLHVKICNSGYEMSVWFVLKIVGWKKNTKCKSTIPVFVSYNWRLVWFVLVPSSSKWYSAVQPRAEQT